jgi:hypothetical protein
MTTDQNPNEALQHLSAGVSRPPMATVAIQTEKFEENPATLPNISITACLGSPYPH